MPSFIFEKIDFKDLRILDVKLIRKFCSFEYFSSNLYCVLHYIAMH